MPQPLCYNAAVRFAIMLPFCKAWPSGTMQIRLMRGHRAEVFMENMENNVGKNIAALRRARGLTQAELAGQLHFTYQAVSNW